MSEAEPPELKDKLSDGGIDVAFMTLTDDLKDDFRAQMLYSERLCPCSFRPITASAGSTPSA